MKLDFDVLEFCRKLKTVREPPYLCPMNACSKTYRSMCGLQYHLVHFDHGNEPMKKEDLEILEAEDIFTRVGVNEEDEDLLGTNGEAGTPQDRFKKRFGTPKSIGKRGKRKARFTKFKNNPKKKKTKLSLDSFANREPMTLAESQRLVEYEIDDKVFRMPIKQSITVLSKHNYELMYPGGGNGKQSLEVSRSKELTPKLPEACFSLVENYSLRPAPPRPISYIRFIEKSPDDLDNEVEYDIDEEDAAWLEIVNDRRAEQGVGAVSADTFELLMDRLEKESYFQGGEPYTVIDDDAVCCICMDGECQNSNVILFCDMCNLAVHQDCYGVPYIPESQWLCRRCLQSPSRAVDCVLCPNNGGAFKQTDRGHWAHVVCALWIPEVRFANTVFLEPIDSIETIPPARWKLTCYICKQKGVGACIQCYKPSCYSAFHVTCAQNAGLFMKMDAIENGETDDSAVMVQKIAYCTTHTPPDAEVRPKPPATTPPRKQNKAPPIISVPTIPPEKIQEIGSTVNLPKKNQFIQRLLAYWTLKRQLRNGVPLLRRLQPTNVTRKDSLNCGDDPNDLAELKNQLKYWQSLRQDLERARLLCELVRKREKLKKELVRVKVAALELKLAPLTFFLRQLLEMLRARDTGEIFNEPVDLLEVPDYADVVKHPMDLSTMRDKVNDFQYENLSQFQADFDLMIINCLTYNAKDTVFYRAGIKMKEQGGALIKQAAIDLEILGIQQITPSKKRTVINDETSASEIDIKFESISNNSFMSAEEKIKNLEKLIELTQNLKNHVARSKRLKSIRTFVSIVKRKRTSEALTKRDNAPSPVTEVEEEVVSKSRRSKRSESCRSKAEEIPEPSGRERKRLKMSVSEEAPEQSAPSPISTPPKGAEVETKATPPGVNRRTTVLFTRKGLKSSPSPTVPVQAPPSRRRGRASVKTDLFKDIPLASDSFRTHRGGTKSEESGSEEEDSSCSECDSSGSQSSSSSETSDSEEDVVSDSTAALEQLQMVWAKCRGYPWYPALIINPLMPKGYTHHGVPVPTPPEDVLALANNYTEPVYLVLFFDTKRTWQWLPRGKLEALGVAELDEAKLTESRKPADRKAVRKAYKEAMTYRNQLDRAASGELPRSATSPAPSTPPPS